MNRPPLALLAVVVVLAAGTSVVSAVDAPSKRRAAPEAAEVVGATAVCPDVRQIPGLYTTRVSVGAAPLPAGRTATGGQAESVELTGSRKATPLPLKEPGQVAVNLATTVNENGVVVSATDALATGLEVEQIARVTDGRFRGLAGLRCEAPKRDAWFVGAGTGLYDLSALVLANVDDTPATVDVTAFGRKGAADPRPGQGITLGAHSRYVIPLDTIAPDGEFLVVHVVSRQGRVVAAVRDARYGLGLSLGFDYVPQALPPAPRVVVPGLPQGPGYRGMVIGNPTDDDTTVSLQATLRDGQFVPAGMEDLLVPARRSVLVDVTKITDGSPATITVNSTGSPVVAGAYLVESQQFQIGGIRETAYGGSTLPLSGPALLTDLVIDRPTESTLVLTATAEAASVVVTPITVLGLAGVPPKPRTLTVPAGRTIAFRLSTFFPPGTQAKLAVEVRPTEGSGPVYATRYLRERGNRGTLATLLTLQGPAQLVSRPAVVSDDEAGYP